MLTGQGQGREWEMTADEELIGPRWKSQRYPKSLVGPEVPLCVSLSVKFHGLCTGEFFHGFAQMEDSEVPQKPLCFAAYENKPILSGSPDGGQEGRVAQHGVG